MPEITVMQPHDWALNKAVRCAALADAPYAFSATLAQALERSDAEWAALTAERANDPDLVTFFALANGTACGTAACRVEPETAEAEMYAVWVAASHRRTGVGAALINFAQSWARQKGATLLKVGVFDDNSGAVAYYCANGFQDVGRTKPELSTAQRTVRLLVKEIGAQLAGTTR